MVINIITSKCISSGKSKVTLQTNLFKIKAKIKFFRAKKVTAEKQSVIKSEKQGTKCRAFLPMGAKPG